MSKSLVTNKVLRNQISEYKGSKYVLTRNNYFDNDLPLELIVRTEKIGNKNATSYYNQYNQYRKLEFTNNKLRIMGNSYSYGMDLSKSKKVERKMPYPLFISKTEATAETAPPAVAQIILFEEIPRITQKPSLPKTQVMILTKDAMEMKQPLKVPLVVDMEYGSSWYEEVE